MATRKNPGRTLSPAQQVSMRETEDLVLRERTRGKSFWKIRQEHGVSNPEKVFERAVRRVEVETKTREDALKLEALRLDELQDGLWDAAVGGNARAVEVALRVLERRSRMHGLDFADLVSGQMVEVEQAKVKVMAGALITAMQAAGLSSEVQHRVATVFMGELRAQEERELSPEDEALL